MSGLLLVRRLRCLSTGSTIFAVSEQEYPGKELREQIERLERELERHRLQERLLAKTLLSATSHAAAIRENARREAELTLRKARAEGEKLKAAAARERDDAKREFLRLHRITEQMRTGLSAFLAGKVEELRLETEGSTNSGQDDELDTALKTALEARSATELHGSAGGPHAVS
jgi:hypothetical protein